MSSTINPPEDNYTDLQKRTITILFYKKHHRTDTPKALSRRFIYDLFEAQGEGVDAPAAIPLRWTSCAQIMQLLAWVVHRHDSVEVESHARDAVTPYGSLAVGVGLGFLGVPPLAPEDAAVRRRDMRVLAREVCALVASLKAVVNGPYSNGPWLSDERVVLHRGGSMPGEVRVQVRVQIRVSTSGVTTTHVSARLDDEELTQMFFDRLVPLMRGLRA